MTHNALHTAEAFIQAGELQDALDNINQHIAEHGTSDVALRLRAAVMARLSGKYRTALDDLDALSEQYPDDYILRAVLLELAGEGDAALHAIAEGHTAYPGHDRLTEHYLYLLRRQGQTQKALDVITGLPEAWRWSQWAGDVSADRGDDLEAVTHYSAAIQTLHVRYNLSDDKAARILENETISEAASLTIPAVYARLLLVRADCLRRLARYEEAEDDYWRAQTLIPNDPTIPFNRGLVAFHRGDMNGARQLIQEALQTDQPKLKASMLAVLETETYAGLHSVK